MSNCFSFQVHSVVSPSENGRSFYQSLSTIEKGRFVDIIQKNNLETVLPHIQGRDSSEVSEVLNPLLSQENLNYYQDKRLIRICQVPQMPYLEKDIVSPSENGRSFYYRHKKSPEKFRANRLA